MGFNFHFGNCGVQIEVFALNIERTEGTKDPKLMEWNLSWPKLNNLKVMEWNLSCLKPNNLRCMEWTLTWAEFNDLKFMEWEVTWQFVNDLILMEWTWTWPKLKWMEWNLTWQFVKDLKIDGMEFRFLVWGLTKTNVHLHSTRKPGIKYVWFNPFEPDIFYVWFGPFFW